MSKLFAPSIGDPGDGAQCDRSLAFGSDPLHDLTPAAAAAELSVGTKTIYRLVHNGSLPAYRLSRQRGRLRIPQAAVEVLKTRNAIVPAGRTSRPQRSRPISAAHMEAMKLLRSYGVSI